MLQFDIRNSQVTWMQALSKLEKLKLLNGWLVKNALEVRLKEI